MSAQSAMPSPQSIPDSHRPTAPGQPTRLPEAPRLGRRFRFWLSRLAYPCTIGLGFALYAVLVSHGWTVTVSSYVAVLAGAAVVLWLEHCVPHRLRWRPDGKEVRTDLLYLVVVQMLLPMALALPVTIWLRDWATASAVTWFDWWPHREPIVIQFLLMLVVADFLRYWLHVAAHRWQWLWRLHAVHHSPERLYWLNVGRFHPLDKTLQYLLDALPFALLGVDETVIASYLVFYAINGFFQHSNIELRHGWLNYVVATAELHRWHHAVEPAVARCNYGNNLIVWDLVFGTRRLGPEPGPTRLGLQDSRYPTGFTAQLVAPFRREKTPPTGHDARNLRDPLLNTALRLRMGWVHRFGWLPLVTAAASPDCVQRAVLREILHRNRDTRFGREHGFHRIETPQEYRDLVPVQSYETLRPYIERQERDGTAELTRDPPCLYARTSGTSGAPKDLPLTARSLAQGRRLQSLFSYVMYRAHPEAFDGRLLLFAGPAVEGRLPGGSPYGSASGHILQSLSSLARAKCVVPPEVFTLSDHALKYRLILRLAIAQPDITAMGGANPSTFLRLGELLREERATLLEDVDRETWHSIDALPRAVRRVVGPRLRCSPARRRELAKILSGARPTFADLWPRLRLLTTWTGGSVGIALDAVRRDLPAKTVVGDLGYVASEFRGTIPVDVESGDCAPTLREHYFEFVETERWECGEPRFLTLDELEPGGLYYVLVTTVSGLYRYFMDDIVRVTGRFGSTPTLAFVQKGRGVTSITGEKVYEAQVIEAVKRAEAELGISLHFFVMLADVDEAHYRLLGESYDAHRGDGARLAERVDTHLGGLNIEYAHKRASGRLGPVATQWLRIGTAEAHKAFCVQRGQREGQFKALVLSYREDWPFAFERYLTDFPGRRRA